jgi:hypothetical protein
MEAGGDVDLDVKGILKRGGRGQIDLLEFCVLSINTDALFAYCVDEYRLRPQAAAAVALHDVFCAADAPARISATAALPPKDVRIERAVHAFRVPAPREAVDRGRPDPKPQAAPSLPPKYLFDSVIQTLTCGGGSPWRRLTTSYDPEKTPHENLPGGKLTAPQRAFVDHVWTPIVRPRLVAAGFWKLATIA